MGLSKSFHIGCQSWGYDDWITPAGGPTVFYPRGTRREDMLGLYARIFGTIEVDSTLYGVPPASSVDGWYSGTPEDFLFSLKFPREITHDHSLDPHISANRGICRALPPGFTKSWECCLFSFPQVLRRQRKTVKPSANFSPRLPHGTRYAMEFRDAAWFTDWTFEELEKAGVALVLVEGTWIDRGIVLDAIPRITTDFAYIRIMGERDLPVFDHIQRDRDAIIDPWAAAIEKLASSDVFIYVDNYFEGTLQPLSPNSCSASTYRPDRRRSLIHRARSFRKFKPFRVFYVRYLLAENRTI